MAKSRIITNAASMLVTHHSISDGLSLAYAIRDTLDALAGRALRALPSAQDDLLNLSASVTEMREQDHTRALKPAVYEKPWSGDRSPGLLLVGT